MIPEQRRLYEAARDLVRGEISPDALKRVEDAVEGIESLDPLLLFSDMELIKSVDEHGVDLTEWEIGFIESITKSCEQHGSLTPKQRAVVVRIHREKVESSS